MHLNTKCEGRTQYVQQKYFILKTSFSRRLVTGKVKKKRRQKYCMLRGLTIYTLYQKLFSDQMEDRTGEIFGMCGGKRETPTWL
jgi:hypothetical protein